jgi:hypothetical protein
MRQATGRDRRCIAIAVLLFTLIISMASICLSLQWTYAATWDYSFTQKKAPIATSGDKNVYVAWWTNKTGNDEVMFKASTYGDKTFSDKVNLSNSSNTKSGNTQIAVVGNNVYVSWWERNATSDEPVMRVSNDSGKTFGEKIMPSVK